ncbi:hypothetical protein N5B55_04925 [Ralstonia pickettii]|uniref:hypothetical protein n=1 Tax=Ralstonia pickettii TaxID=329 RepID=UPI00271516E8|nr:hypothetical protein [Ralstonia pickettii]WKZ86297.1 hypothetical protein N5B55_04925 [Ralstonia pickettii]
MLYHYEFFERNPDGDPMALSWATTNEPLQGIEAGKDYILSQDVPRGGATEKVVTLYRVEDAVFGAGLSGQNSFQLTRVYLRRLRELTPFATPNK